MFHKHLAQVSPLPTHHPPVTSVRHRRELLTGAHWMTAPTSVPLTFSLFPLALPRKPCFPSFFLTPHWRTALKESLTQGLSPNWRAFLGNGLPLHQRYPGPHSVPRAACAHCSAHCPVGLRASLQEGRGGCCSFSDRTTTFWKPGARVAST